MKRPSRMNPAWGLLLCVALVQPALAKTAAEAITDGVFERLQKARAAASIPGFDRRVALDTIARERAAEIAGLPHAMRMKAIEPIGEAFERAGIKRTLRYAVHQDMNRGYTNPANGFFRNWKKYNQAWAKALDPEFNAIGIATAKGDDLWWVLIVILFSDVEIESETSLESKAVRVINDIRQQHHLEPLALDGKLANVARMHSRDMADRDYFAHESPAGESMGDRVTRTGIGFERVAENLQMSMGIRDPVQTAADEWMKSPAHRTNILDPGFTHTGVGVAVTDAGAVYFTQVFIKTIVPDP
jgi:uncharacterized protein YkwD